MFILEITTLKVDILDGFALFETLDKEGAMVFLSEVAALNQEPLEGLCSLKTFSKTSPALSLYHNATQMDNLELL